MAESPRSSFIPRQSSTAIPAKMQRRRTFSVFNFLASVILIASLIAAGGAYFYKGVAEKKLVEAQLKLKAESEKFGIEKLNEVRDFNRQLLAVRYLLDHHIAPSKIFDALELDTLGSVQFMEFTLEYDPEVNDVLLTVLGGTEEFKTVALQALKFSEQPLLKDAFFTELGSKEVTSNEIGVSGTNDQFEHEVNFTVAGKVPSELLVYGGTEATQAVTEGVMEAETVEEVPQSPETVSSPI